jgi:hypothetical protein
MAQRPTRQKKEDRLTNPRATAAQIRCDVCLGPFDQAVRAADKRWGVDRLPEIVSPDSALKWGKAMAGLNDAIQSEDPDKVKFWVEVCLRGLQAMDDEATKSGQPISDPQIWEYEYEGQQYGIIEDGRHWPAAYAKRPKLVIFTMREVAIALHAHRNGLVEAVKLAFPGAEISGIKDKGKNMEDDIDFDFAVTE